VCEICGAAPPRRDDVMCSDCAGAYQVLFDLLQDHPELDREGLERLKAVYEWRMRTIRVIPSS